MLANLSVVRKMLLIVALPALAILLVSAVGVQSSFRLGDNIAEVDAGGRATVLAARMNTNIQALNALQHQLAADPGAVAAASKGVAAETKLFTERMAAIRTLLPTERLRGIAELEQNFTLYIAALDKVGQAAAAGNPAALAETRGAAAQMAATMREQVRAFFRQAEEHSIAVVASAEQAADRMRTIMPATAAAGLMLGIGAALIIARRGVANPLEATVQSLSRLAVGDLEAAIPGLTRGDEIGKVATAVQTFKENLIRQRAMEAEKAARVAAEQKRAARLEQLARDFDGGVRGVLSAVGNEAHELETTSALLSSAAEQSARQAQTVAAAAVEAAASVNTVAAAAEELSGSIVEISRQVAHAHDVSQQAVIEAGQADELVRSLAATTQRIAQVADLIHEIASQTNMLSLNATIEASRAGDAGKGFTVVAGEVKHLAIETAQATRQVSEQIRSVLDRTGKAAAAVHAITAILRDVDEVSTTIASAVEQQSAATAEIARNVEQASQGADDVSSNIIGIEQAAAETGRSATTVLGLARSLTGDSGALKKMVEDFLASVRALS